MLGAGCHTRNLSVKDPPGAAQRALKVLRVVARKSENFFFDGRSAGEVIGWVGNFGHNRYISDSRIFGGRACLKSKWHEKRGSGALNEVPL